MITRRNLPNLMLCLAGQTEQTGLLLCDRAKVEDEWITTMDPGNEKIVLAETGSGTAGLCGIGDWALVRRVTGSDLGGPLQDVSAASRRIARQSEKEAWSRLQRFENGEEQSSGWECEEILSRWRDPEDREELCEDLKDDLIDEARELANSRFLYLRVGPSGPELYEVGSFGSFIYNIDQNVAAIGNGTVAFNEWMSRLGRLPEDCSLVDLTIDLLSIYSVGLDTLRVVGAPVLKVLREDHVLGLTATDEAVLINLTGGYLSGNLPRPRLVEAVRLAFDGTRLACKEEWLEKLAGRLGVSVALLQAEGKGRHFWLRRCDGSGGGQAAQVGPCGVFADDLREGRTEEVPAKKIELKQFGEALSSIHEQLDHPLSDWDPGEQGIQPDSFTPEGCMRFFAGEVLSESSMPRIWSRVFEPLIKRVEGIEVDDRRDLRYLRPMAHLTLYLRALWNSWPEWKEKLIPVLHLRPPLTYFREDDVERYVHRVLSEKYGTELEED